MYLLRCLLPLALVVTHASAQDAGEDPKGGTLVDCGAEKVAIFANTESADGHFALGWTLRPNRKKDPVDWTAYNRNEPTAIMEKFPMDDEEPAKGDYLVVDGILDLTASKFSPLPTEDPYFPGKNHWNIAVAWSDDRPGARFAVVSIDARFSTADLLLVHLASADMRTILLSPTADKAVKDRMRKRDPKDYQHYQTIYEVGTDSSANLDKPTRPEFQKDSVTIHFDTGEAKSQVNYDVGHLAFALSDGKILQVVFDKKNKADTQ